MRLAFFMIMLRCIVDGGELGGDYSYHGLELAVHNPSC